MKRYTNENGERVTLLTTDEVMTMWRESGTDLQWIKWIGEMEAAGILYNTEITSGYTGDHHYIYHPEAEK